MPRCRATVGQNERLIAQVLASQEVADLLTLRLAMCMIFNSHLVLIHHLFDFGIRMN